MNGSSPATHCTLVIAALLVGCVGSGAGRSAVVQTSADVPAGTATKLVVHTAGGHITIGPGPAGNVHVDVTRRAATEADASALAVVTSASADVVTARWDGAAPDDSVTFSITAPPSMVIDATTSGGNVDVHDWTADATLSTAGGQVQTSNVVGALQATTAGGSIDVEQHTGSVAAQTGAGTITLRGTLTGPTSTVATGGGDIEVAVPATSTLVVSAETAHGLASNDFGLPVVTVDGRESFDGRLGDGTGGALTIQTLGGAVSLRELP
jgi:hypothetical protein